MAYVYGPRATAVEQISGSTALWLHHDQLGSTRLVTNTAGSSVATYSFDPYGKLNAITGTIANPIRFSGEYLDAESGMYYLRARYYEPATGQFLSRDPAVAKTREPYAYVNDNPLNSTDPSGLLGWNDVKTFLHKTAQLSEAAGDLLATASVVSGYVGGAAVVAGAALTATGIGAPVGVPLAFAGGALVAVSVPLSGAAVPFHLLAGLGGESEGYYQGLWDVVGIGTSGIGRGIAKRLFDEGSHSLLNKTGEQAIGAGISWAESVISGLFDPSNGGSKGCTGGPSPTPVL